MADFLKNASLVILVLRNLTKYHEFQCRNSASKFLSAIVDVD